MNKELNIGATFEARLLTDVVVQKVVIHLSLLSDWQSATRLNLAFNGYA